MSCEEQYEKKKKKKKNILEEIFYRTTHDERKTTMNFTSNAFFHMFLSKLKAEIDETPFISKCVTHNKVLKCEIIFDSHFCNVTVTGVGNRIGRDYYFPKAAHCLFKKYLQDVDRRELESSESSCVSSGEESTKESSSTTSSDESSTESSSMTSSVGSNTEYGITYGEELHAEDSRIFF